MKKIDWKLTLVWFALISAPICFFVEKKFFTNGHILLDIVFLFNLGILIALVLDEFWQVK